MRSRSSEPRYGTTAAIASGCQSAGQTISASLVTGTIVRPLRASFASWQALKGSSLSGCEARSQPAIL